MHQVLLGSAQQMWSPPSLDPQPAGDRCLPGQAGLNWGSEVEVEGSRRGSSQYQPEAGRSRDTSRAVLSILKPPGALGQSVPPSLLQERDLPKQEAEGEKRTSS